MLLIYASRSEEGSGADEGDGSHRQLFHRLPSRRDTQPSRSSTRPPPRLLRISAATNDDGDDEDHHPGLPPIAQNESILFLSYGSRLPLSRPVLSTPVPMPHAASLVSLTCDNDRHGKFIIEDGDVSPLLCLVKEGQVDGQEAAACAIGLLAHDPTASSRWCSPPFVKVLKDGPMSSSLTIPKIKDVFYSGLVPSASSSDVSSSRQHSRYTIPPKVTSIYTVFVANNTRSTEGQLLGMIKDT